MCQGKDNEKTKTRYVMKRLKSAKFERGPLNSVLNRTKSKARMLIMSLFGMLKCAKNFKYGLGGAECRDCGEIDDESHHINDCSRIKEINLYSSPVKFDFDSIFSADNESISRTLEVVDHLWNLDNGRNEMRCAV